MKIKYPLEYVHTLSIDEIVQTFKTNVEKGISQSEAESRTKEFGANVYAAQKQKSIWLILLLQFNSSIVYLLLFAVAVTIYFQNYIEAIAIGVVIFVNALIGFFMELQARSSMNALKEMDIILSKVIRDGKMLHIPSEKITVGDLIFLEAGDVIPGDAHLVEANQLQCDESSLTGESLPTEKNTEKLAKETALGDQLNMVFKGTAVINGNGKAVITGIAESTQLGTITSLVDSHKETKTPLDKKIAALRSCLS
jgi:P-type Ca2+ transporter type 2C